MELWFFYRPGGKLDWFYRKANDTDSPEQIAKYLSPDGFYTLQKAGVHHVSSNS